MFYKNISENCALSTPLGSVAELSTGIISSRLTSGHTIYDMPSFQEDTLHTGLSASKTVTKNLCAAPQTTHKHALAPGDVVFSQSLLQATLVSPANAGKILTPNFVKAAFNNTAYDPLFFVYLCNANLQFRQQLQRVISQSATTARLSLSSLRDLQLPQLTLEQQRQITATYAKGLLLKNQLQQQAKLVDSLVASTAGTIKF